jgi:hypothetical protein
VIHVYTPDDPTSQIPRLSRPEPSGSGAVGHYERSADSDRLLGYEQVCQCETYGQWPAISRVTNNSGESGKRGHTTWNCILRGSCTKY